jgi:hypothetical protein
MRPIEGSFTDEPLILNNSGRCALSIFGVSSSSPDFVVASILSYPVVIGSGDSIDLVVRFQPSSFGPKAGTITILSNDPTGPHVVAITGVAPAPKANLIIADSGNFGDVCVGSFADEPLIVLTAASARSPLPESRPAPAISLCRKCCLIRSRSGQATLCPYPSGFSPRALAPRSGQSQSRVTILRVPLASRSPAMRLLASSRSQARQRLAA